MTKRQKMTTRASVITAAAVLGVGFVGLWTGWFGTQASAEPQTGVIPETPVAVMAAELRNEVELQRRYTGRVVARRSTTLSFEREGRVEAILVDEGDAVTAGQILARLDTEALRARRRELVAQRAAAEARLEEMRNGPRAQTIAAARARVQEQAAQLALADRDVERLSTLIEQADATDKEFADAKNRAAIAAAQLAFAREQLDELLAGTRVEQIAAQEAMVARAAAAIEQVDVQLSKSELVAPFDGTVAERLVDEGAVLSPINTAVSVLRLLETGALEARVGLPADVAMDFEPGAPATLTIAGNPVAATVKTRIPELDPTTRTQTVLFTLAPDQAGHLTPGRMVRLAVKERRMARGFWIRLDGLVKGERGLWAAFALQATGEQRNGQEVYRLERRPVEVLHTEADRAFVSGLVEDGTLLVDRGAHRVVHGEHVTVAQQMNNTTTETAPETR